MMPKMHPEAIPPSIPGWVFWSHCSDADEDTVRMKALEQFQHIPPEDVLVRRHHLPESHFGLRWTCYIAARHQATVDAWHERLRIWAKEIFPDLDI